MIFAGANVLVTGFQFFSISFWHETLDTEFKSWTLKIKIEPVNMGIMLYKGTLKFGKARRIWKRVQKKLFFTGKQETRVT